MECLKCSSENIIVDPDDDAKLLCLDCGNVQTNEHTEDLPHDHEREYRDNEINQIINSYR